MIILGVNITNCVGVEEKERRIQTFDRYTGEPDGYEEIDIYCYKADIGQIHVSIEDDAENDTEGVRFLEELERQLATFQLGLWSEYKHCYYEDNSLYVGVMMEEEIPVDKVLKLYHSKLQNFLNVGFDKNDIRLHSVED